MKKLLITLFIAISSGGVFAYVIYKNMNKEIEMVINNANVISFFQVGVFKNVDNASKYMQNFSSSIIIKDNDYYRVIIAILQNEEAITKLKEYFSSQNINYYLKKESISDLDFLSKLKEYEQAILTSDFKTYNTINKSILKLYESKEDNATKRATS